MTRVEGEVRDIRSILEQMLPMLIRIDAIVTATLPHLATKAEPEALRGELAEKPGTAYLWGILATLIATYAGALAALALLRH